MPPAAAIAGGAALSGGLGIIGAGMGSRADLNAANQRAAADQQAAALEGQQYNQIRSDEQPWTSAGTNALSQMQNPYFQQNFSAQDFQTDPGYQFRLQQGQQALEASAAARGQQFSGNTLEALTNYNQGFASNEYQNAYNRFVNDQNNRFGRLSSLASLGQNAQNQVNAAGMHYADAAGNDYMNSGNTLAQGTIGSANAWTGALSNLGSSISGGANNFAGYQAYNARTQAMMPPPPNQGSIPTSQPVAMSDLGGSYGGGSTTSMLAMV